MADIVTFDPIDLRIIEIDTSQAVNELDIVEVYSEWKDWLLADSSRLGFPRAFRVISEPFSATQDIGPFFFLGGGWKIRPAEYNHKLTIVGTLVSDPVGDSVFAPTLGAFNVNTETEVSSIVTSVAGSTPSDVANAVWNSVLANHTGAGTMGERMNRLLRALIVLGLEPSVEVVHGDTFIKAPADGSVLSINVTKAGATTTLQSTL